MLSLALGALQLMLDRGALKDWFNSTEICIEAALASVGCICSSSIRQPRPTARFSAATCSKARISSPGPSDVPDRRHPQRHARAGPDDAAGSLQLPVMTDRVCYLAARFRDDGRDVHRRTAGRQSRIAALDPGRAGADRGVTVADDRILAGDGQTPVSCRGCFRGSVSAAHSCRSTRWRCRPCRGTC